MTNREWLNKLSDKELAGELHGCKHCAYIGEFCCERPEYKNCVDGITEWLNAEHIEPMPELQVGDIVEIAPSDGIPAKRYVILPNYVAILVNDFSRPQPATRITIESLRALSCRMVWRYFPNEYLVIWRADSE